jgi:hypothetical protein
VSLLAAGFELVDASDLVSFDQTVPRHLVHRAAVAEVLLTSCHPIAGDLFVLGAQWPRTHGFYTPTSGLHDPMLLAETIRQSGMLVAHQAFGVPYGTQFALAEIRLEVEPASLAVTGVPAQLTAYLSCHDIHKRPDNGTLSRMRIELQIFRDGMKIGSGGGSFSCMTPERYARFRAATKPKGVPMDQELPAPVSGGAVGRDRECDVVLSPADADGTWLLRMDRDHPILFDHPLDHVPGMGLLEAMRQVALAIRHPEPALPLSIQAAFTSYVELDTPCLIRATTGEDGAVHVSVEQHDQVRTTGVVSLHAL